MPKKKNEIPEPVPDETVPSREPDVAEHVPEPVTRLQRRTVSEDILQLNDEEIGITSEDSEDAKWGYLAGAARRQQILTGVVSHVVRSETGNHACAIDVEGMRVLIPIREMVLTECPEDEPVPKAVWQHMQHMLGATVDFIPAAVDVRNRAAVGSRKAAMLQRQKQFYASGRVKPGILVACRVLSVGSFAMTVEACGVDTEILARNVSWEWFTDISELYSTGDLVIARVTDVHLNEESGRYSLDLSIKAATEHSDRAAFEKMIPKSNYFGTVTGIRNGVIFVRLQCGVNAKTRVFRCPEHPSRLDTVSFRVTGLDDENLVALGFITRIIKRHTRLR